MDEEGKGGGRQNRREGLVGRRSRGGLWRVGVEPVLGKELGDHLTGLRFAILLLLVGVASLASVYSPGQALQEVAFQAEGARNVFLALFTASGKQLPSFVSFLAFLGPLLGIALGFDSLNSERSQGTLSRLIPQPIHRDAVLDGKFLAGLATITLMLIVLIFLVAGLGLIMVGVPPSLEEILRLIIFGLVTLLYVGFWLALTQLFSVIFRQSSTSALASDRRLALLRHLRRSAGGIGGGRACPPFPPIPLWRSPSGTRRYWPLWTVCLRSRCTVNRRRRY